MTTNGWKGLTALFALLTTIAGTASAWRPILFPVQQTGQLTNFVNKIVEEGGHYTIIADAIQIDLIVRDVSVKRREVKVEIGLSWGVRQPVQIEVNKETPVPLGAKVYVLVANEVYDVNPGPDIAVLSIMEKRS